MEHIGLLQGIYTLLALVAFVWICIWAMGRGRRAAFDAASRIPLEDDDTPAGGTRPRTDA